jgi:hypothetical protein
VVGRACSTWCEIADHLPGRTPRQCRDRWLNYLCPSNSFAPWTPDEDRIIIQKVSTLGNKWAEIAKFLPGRSDNGVKNRWYASLRANTGTNGAGKRAPRTSVEAVPSAIVESTSNIQAYVPNFIPPPDCSRMSGHEAGHETEMSLTDEPVWDVSHFFRSGSLQCDSLFAREASDDNGIHWL